MSADAPADATPAAHLELARESLQSLLTDERLPAEVRESMQSDYQEIESMLARLEHGHLHIAAFGRVSTGKSSLLNAIAGANIFSTSPLHGETRMSQTHALEEADAGGVHLVDTPGIDEAFAPEREARAVEVAERADLVLFVVDADLTAMELAALRALRGAGRPVVLVLNKSDRYTVAELDSLVTRLKEHSDSLVLPEHVVTAAADPRPEILVIKGPDGAEQRQSRSREPDIQALTTVLWEVVEREGKTLAALNATLFAADLSDKVAARLVQVRSDIADRLIRTYCYGKGVTVALNPVPVADLLAAAFIDAGMIVHLSRIYGLPLTANEAGKLVRIIVTEAAALMGTVWAIHFLASALKVGTAGLSTFVTAGAQGAVAWYSTFVVGEAARSYLAAGKSWGEAGPKRAIREILDSLDRESILAEARADIRARMGKS